MKVSFDDFDHLYLAHALSKPCSSTGRKYALNNQVRLITRVYGIDMFIPKPTRIELQIHPNEHVLILEGENLWFCHKLQLSECDNRVDTDTNFQNVTQHMIRFTFPPNEKLLGLVAEGEVKVALHSHFAHIALVRQNIQVVRENTA